MRFAGLRQLMFALCEDVMVWISEKLNGISSALLDAVAWLRKRSTVAPPNLTLVERCAVTEDELERAIVSYLDATLTKLHSCLHLAKGNSLTGFWDEKASPALMRAGAPRLAIVGVGKIYLIFTRTLGDDLSELEQEFKAWCATHDTPYCVARCVDDVRIALEHWRIPVRAAA